METRVGEIAALATACFWTVTALAFEAAARRIGSLNVNLVRLPLAFLFLAFLTLATRGLALPVDATPRAWLLLSASGLIGYFVGDLFLFQAFILIGSRIAMLIMTAAPLFTTIIGFAALGERPTALALAGIALVTAGIALTVLTRGSGRGLRVAHPLRGIACALVGALGQAVGLVLSKAGMQGYDPFAAGQVRILAGFLGFLVFAAATGRLRDLSRARDDVRALGLTSLGAFFGPFLGVSCSLIAVARTDSGIAAALMSIVPLLIIPPSLVITRERVAAREVAGALVTVAGVVVLFVRA